LAEHSAKQRETTAMGGNAPFAPSGSATGRNDCNRQRSGRNSTRNTTHVIDALNSFYAMGLYILKIDKTKRIESKDLTMFEFFCISNYKILN